MSQKLLPPNITECVKCGHEINRGKKGTRKVCDDCIIERRHEYYKANRILLKLGRLQDRKCKRCHGKITKLISYGWASQYCSDYCKWMNGIRRLKERNEKLQRFL